MSIQLHRPSNASLELSFYLIQSMFDLESRATLVTEMKIATPLHATLEFVKAFPH